MPNDIPSRQNLTEFVDRIAASSRAYGTVKGLAKAQTLLVLSSAIIGPLVAIYAPHHKAWAALYAVAVLLLDLLYLEPEIRVKQKLGAKIQEVFDTELFGIPWNFHRCHGAPDHEEINSLAAEFKKKETTTRLLDWYPTVAGEVPIEYGRLICQRANMRWDAAMRRYYCHFFVAILAAMILSSLGIAIFKNWDAEHIIISLILPLLPAAIKLIRERHKHQDSAESSERAKSMLESLWSRALNEMVTKDQFREESRRLQDELYERRTTSPAVPQFVYMMLKNDFERDMRAASTKMVADAKSKLAATVMSG